MGGGVPTLARPPGRGENHPAAVPRPLHLVCSFSAFGTAAFLFSLSLKTERVLAVASGGFG